jgi:hypothetical protein
MILSSGSAFNAPGISTEPTAEGVSGTLRNLPVFVANSLPSNHGTSTNADEVIVLRGSDVFLYEGELALEPFDSTYANQGSILLRALSFVGMIPDRWSACVNLVNGNGLVAPDALETSPCTGSDWFPWPGETLGSSRRRRSRVQHGGIRSEGAVQDSERGSVDTACVSSPHNSNASAVMSAGRAVAVSCEGASPLKPTSPGSGKGERGHAV